MNRDAPCVLPVGLPLLPLDLVQREGWRYYWMLGRCSLRLPFPRLLQEQGCQESLSSLHALRGDELGESSEACSLLRSSRASRVLPGEAWKDRRACSRSDGSRDRSCHWRFSLCPVRGPAVEDLVVIARLDRYLPVNGHVVIDCGLLTAVDLVVLALARCLGVAGCGILTAAGLAWTSLGVTSCGFCPLSVSVRAFTSICSPGSSQ